MKKVTLTVNGFTNVEGINDISGALNDLSGVVAADVVPTENKAYAYAGDKLAKETLESAIRNAGYQATVTSEEYLKDIYAYKNSMQ